MQRQNKGESHTLENTDGGSRSFERKNAKPLDAA